MRIGLVLSLLAHVAIVMAAVVTLPSAFDAADDFQMVPIEILQLGDETNVRAAAPDSAEKPEPEALREEQPRFAEAPPPPPAMDEPVDDDAMPALESRVEPKPKPKDVKKLRARKTMPRRKPRPPAPENSELDLGELQALLDKAPREEPKPQAQPTDDALDSLDEFLAEDQEDLPRRAVGLGNALTVSEVEALAYAMQKCWRPPMGAANAEQFVVTLRIHLLEDGSLDSENPPITVSKGGMKVGGGSFSKAFETSARRAVFMCAPYDFLPINKYERWKVVTITFDPASMVGY